MSDISREFWEKVGVDYENNLDLTSCLRRFCTSKSGVIKEETSYNSKSGFVEELEDATNQKIKTEVLNVFFEYHWTNKRSEQSYNFQESDVSISDVESEFENVGDSEECPKGFILWVGEETREQIVENGSVSNIEYEKANVVVIREYEEKVDVRSLKEDYDMIESTLSNSDSFNPEQPDPIEDEIVKDFDELITLDSRSIKTKSVVFDSTKLPRNSSIKIKNEVEIAEDIDKLQDLDILSYGSISDISSIKFDYRKRGRTFNLKVEKKSTGFKFTVSSNSGQTAREDFIQDFEDLTNIKINKLYKYNSQNSRLLFNSILSEDSDAYTTYYNELSEEIQDELEKFIIVTDLYLCPNSSCEEDWFEDNMKQVPTCPDCQTEGQDKNVVDIEVQQTQIASTVRKKLEEYDLDGNNDFIEDFSIENQTQKIGESNGQDIKTPVANMRIVDKEAEEITPEYINTNFVPIGNFQKPTRINNYLLDAVFVKYGDAFDNTIKNFATLDLFELLFEGYSDEDIGSKIQTSVKLRRDRVRDESRNAYNIAQEYQQLVKEEGYENSDRLDEFYSRSGKEFEKHIFYLFKDMLPKTERLGHSGDAEADGIVFCPRKNSDHFVFTYDTKNSHSKSGYSVGSAEKDQAFRYLLSSNCQRDIRNMKADDSEIQDAHAIISNNLKKNKIESMQEWINERYRDLENQNLMPSKKQYVIFIKFEAILELYDFYEAHWSRFQDSKYRKLLEDCIVTELLNTHSEEEYVVFDSESVSNIREELLSFF